MFEYAQIDDRYKVVAISQLVNKVDNNVLIDITNIEKKPSLGFIYNPATGAFTEPEEVLLEPQPTLEEISEENLLETKYQTLLLEMML